MEHATIRRAGAGRLPDARPPAFQAVIGLHRARLLAGS